jgi:hypothetical protein
MKDPLGLLAVGFPEQLKIRIFAPILLPSAVELRQSSLEMYTPQSVGQFYTPRIGQRR